MSLYQKMIKENLDKQGYFDRYDPRHIEAWMRDAHGCLDALSPVAFRVAAEDARKIVHQYPELSERLAQCEGL